MTSRLGAAAAAAAAAAAEFDVIIVGAGVSGLQAAQTLRDEYGINNVVVVEASQHIGG
jgi:flavin-dependent dehydrogenase